MSHVIINEYDIHRAQLPQDTRPFGYHLFFSSENVAKISREVTKRLAGVHPEGKNIIVPHETILSVMDSIYENNYRDVDKLTMMTISYIVEYITNEYEIERQNNNLNIWITNYPIESGIRQHPPIKLREKRPTPMVFHMRY